MVVSQLTRTIEISHWGNIAVEETVDMYHSGAKLKGPFSRLEYMRRQGGASSVKSFKTMLPPASSDVYYRDEIGNISTSNLRVPKSSKVNSPVELELRPRFPLFGGWKTHYTIGYNVPVYQFLFNKGITKHAKTHTCVIVVVVVNLIDKHFFCFFLNEF